MELQDFLVSSECLRYRPYVLAKHAYVGLGLGTHVPTSVGVELSADLNFPPPVLGGGLDGLYISTRHAGFDEDGLDSVLGQKGRKLLDVPGAGLGLRADPL